MIGLGTARLRPSGYAGHASFFGHLVAAPREARRAKRGGARRDRTADLLHAMQALSQLSYGPTLKSRRNLRTAPHLVKLSGPEFRRAPYRNARARVRAPRARASHRSAARPRYP